VVRVADALAEALPGVETRSVEIVEEGWDSVVAVVDGTWVLRVARDERFANSYELEAALMRELAPLLPIPVPVISRHTEDWALTPFIAGRTFRGRRGGVELASFLRALHDFPVERARAVGLPEHDRTLSHARFSRHVLPNLKGRELERAEALLTEYVEATHPWVTAHTDLSAAHVLVRRGAITGIIDWADARIADPAIDLAWPLFGTPRRFADEVARTYSLDAALIRRALVLYTIDPWHEVVHADEEAAHAAALWRVRERLREATGRLDTMAE
jgi:aminoglycoside phosphotransferase (APT) family kinase protein